MVTLCIVIILLIISFLLTGWILAVAARAVRSPRASLGVGLLGALLIVLINLVLFSAGATVTMHTGLSAAVVNAVISLLDIGLVFLMLRRLFRLSFWRTCVPYIASVVLSLMQIGLAVMVVRPFLTETFFLSDRSMAPTIRPGDLFVANKLMRPHRWDLVVCRSGDPRHVLECRRVIGLPGDHLMFKDGQIEINGHPIAAPDVIAGRCHASPTSLPSQQDRYLDGQSIVLDSDEYFLLGDNLDVAADSRMGGPVPQSLMIGVVDLIYWPPGRFRVLR